MMVSQLAAPHSPFRSLALLAGALATAAAVAVGAVLAIFAAATVVVIALMSTTILALTGMAFRVRRTAKAGAADGVIEARNVGGHHWVAYGWNDRA
jgi:hypothetical protein